MPDWIDHLKVLLPLLAVVAVGAGFYYTTNHRLDHLEEVVDSMNSDNDGLHLKLHVMETKLRKQEETLSKMRKTLHKKQDKRK